MLKRIPINNLYIMKIIRYSIEKVYLCYFSSTFKLDSFKISLYYSNSKESNKISINLNYIILN